MCILWEGWAWAKDCYKKKADMQVRQVEENDPKDAAHSSGTAAASATAIRAVQIFEPPTTHVHVEDLTVFSQPSSSGSPFRLCVVSEVCSVCATPCVEFDMTCTDGDSRGPFAQISIHVVAVIFQMQPHSTCASCD